ncbi:hypothetical protein SCHPADRAFT_914795 [Schizopora paradoxa]|uniref:Uncharacterized protein n=1 Tax=Schizopora paradoxa TaxID=27342 RepID=A0A0H2RSN4_9AGAM|nr:hypothetical protein SCHPADRAFT_914795 [Schizopora paradoxa]
MHALKSPFLRPISRPTSPAPPSRTDTETPPIDRSARPLTKLSSLTNFNRKPSPAPVSTPTQATLTHDGSYLDALSLKLNEAASKALSQPVSAVATPDTLGGKRPIPVGRGRTLGELIAAELNTSQGNSHLQRAILRLLQRPLTVLLSNLSTALLPLLSNPAFSNPSAPSVQNPNLNAIQAHALGIATFAGELLDCLDELKLDASHDHKGDGLLVIKEGLGSVMKRVINPLMSGIKTDLVPLIQDLEKGNVAAVPTTTGTKVANGTKAPANLHPSIATLQTLMPIYARALGRYCSTKSSEASLATFLISIMWNAVVALSHRPSSPRSRANSASATSAASMSMTFIKRFGGSTTPPNTPPASRFTMKLPGSRPPSPPALAPSAAEDANALYNLLSTLPKPAPSKDNLPSEAVKEAFEALAALTALLSALGNTTEIRDDLDLDILTEGLPVPIALPILLRWSGHGEPQVIPAMLGTSETEYRSGCLSGFGRADECAYSIAHRMVEILRSEADPDPKTSIVIGFLEECLAH